MIEKIIHHLGNKIGLHEVIVKVIGGNDVAIICENVIEVRNTMDFIESKLEVDFITNYSENFISTRKACIHFINMEKGINKYLGYISPYHCIIADKTWL